MSSKLSGILGMVAGGVVAAWLAWWMDAGRVALWWSAVGGCIAGCLVATGMFATARRMFERQWPTL